MKKYEEYKNSGVQWIGEIPEGWEFAPLKRYLKESMKYGANESAESDEPSYPRYIRITDIDSNGNLKDETFKSLEPIKAKDYLLKRDDILFARSGATVGKSFLFDSDAAACYAGYLIKAVCNKKKLLPKYLLYYTRSTFYDNWKKSIFIQATIQNISAEKYSMLQVILPPLSEQQSIASFLDAKTKPIDDIISKREKQIELLEEMKSAIISHAVTKGLNPDAKMKDSGIEWIGEIPEGWSIIRLKHLASLYGRIGYRGYTQQDIVPQGEGAITISPSNMVKGHMNFEKCTYLSWAKYNESPEIMIHNNDILLVKTGSTYGKVAIVKNIPLEATINPQIVAIKNIKCNPDLLNYILCTPYVHLQVENTVIGSLFPICIKTRKIKGNYKNL